MLGAPDDVVVVVDVNCRPTIIEDREAYRVRLRRVLARADVVKVSDEDLAFLRPGVEHEAAAHELLAGGARVVLVTTGGTATTIVTAGGHGHGARRPGCRRRHDRRRRRVHGRLRHVVAGERPRSRRRSPTSTPSPPPSARPTPSPPIVVGRRGADPPRRDELPAGWL